MDMREAARAAARRVKAWDYGKGFSAFMNQEALAASTPYILVDLSDNVNFPHDGVNEIIVKRIRVATEKASDGAYDIWLGVVTASSAVAGRADWFHVLHLEASGNPTDSTDRFATELDFGDEGLNLHVLNGAPEHFVSNVNQQGGTASNWQSDVYRTTPAGSAFPAVGDLVMWVEETAGTGTIDVAVGVDYDTL